MGIDHLFFADHVSFHTGAGLDALVTATALSQLHPTLGMQIGVYLLPLRNPMVVSRMLSTAAELAPGRIVFGVGVGGEDRHEVELCGVDPRTRGRRCDEALAILRGLEDGDEFDFDGEFFSFERGRIVPAPDPKIPILVGGRSDAALRRTARYGDGWLATWLSVNRFRQASELIVELADGREPVGGWRHALQTWIGFGPDAETARSHVGPAMERFYRIPFERFEKYTPFGTPEAVAEALMPYRELGVEHFNLTPCAANADEASEGVAEVKRLLSS